MDWWTLFVFLLLLSTFLWVASFVGIGMTIYYDIKIKRAKLRQTEQKETGK